MQVRETNNLIRILPEDRLDPHEAQRLYLELIVFLRTKGAKVSTSEYISALYTLIYVYTEALMEHTDVAQDELQAAVSRLWALVKPQEIAH